MTRASRWLKNGSLLLLWIMASVLVLELVLQASAALMKEHSWRAKSQWLTGHLRILALGDSNTYGLYLPAEDAWPSQLEVLWNQQHPQNPVEVINLGYPGTNSFRLLANLPELLDTFQPDLVLLMIGFNDFWTPVEIPRTVEELPLLKKVLYHSRLYQLLYMWLQTRELEHSIDSGRRMLGGLAGIEFTPAEQSYLEQASGLTLQQLQALTQEQLAAEPAIQEKLAGALQSIMEERNQHPHGDILNTVKYGDQVFSLGITQGDSARHSKYLQQNIQAMLSLLQQRQVPYFLLSYPTRHGYYPAANKKIVALATEQSLPFIDLQSVFHPDCQVKPDQCPELLFYDAHATAKGNQLIAEKIASELANYLTVSEQ